MYSRQLHPFPSIFMDQGDWGAWGGWWCLEHQWHLSNRSGWHTINLCHSIHPQWISDLFHRKPPSFTQFVLHLTQRFVKWHTSAHSMTLPTNKGLQWTLFLQLSDFLMFPFIPLGGIWPWSLFSSVVYKDVKSAQKISQKHKLLTIICKQKLRC